jgi:hypothetical protein
MEAILSPRDAAKPAAEANAIDEGGSAEEAS